jgi:uncharacterized protein (UPF0335 family)
MFERQGAGLDRDRDKIGGITLPCFLTVRRRSPIAGPHRKNPRREHFSRCFRWVQAGANSNKGKFQMKAEIAGTGVAAQELTQFVERVEQLEEEKRAISGDIREVYAEMKGCGFDVKAVREIVKIRKQDHSERKEMEAILKFYMATLNMT